MKGTENSLKDSDYDAEKSSEDESVKEEDGAICGEGLMGTDYLKEILPPPNPLPTTNFTSEESPIFCLIDFLVVLYSF